MSLELELDNSVFVFQRSIDGEGRWISLRGRVAGNLGDTPANIFVPLELNALLTRTAIERGLGTLKDFARWQKKEKKEKVARVSSGKKKRKFTGVYGGFSLSSFFFDADPEEKDLSEAESEEVEREDDNVINWIEESNE